VTAERPASETKPGPSALARGFASAADRAAHWIGQPHTFIVLCVGIALWAAAVFVLRIPDGWARSLDAITIVTFLMVFLIQSTQNRSGAAIQAKLDELIRAHAPAENKFMGIEKLTVEEVHELRKEGEVEVEVETVAASASARPRKKKRGS
jgi:low affinity Fe/Cu permease